MKRPGPARWLWYAFGGGLPADFDEWVLRDTTSPTWVLRHLSHALAQLAPVVLAVLLLVPGPVWIRAVGVVAATAMGLLFSFAYMVETTDRRLTRAGYGSGLGEQLRHERSSTARTESTRRRLDKIAARHDRRRTARAS